MHRMYSNDDITVFWDSDRCQHARKCVEGCPKAFRFGRKPWINLDGTVNKEVWNTVKQCPSGALDIIYNHEIRIEFIESEYRSIAYDKDKQVGECDFEDTDEGFRIYHTEVLPEYKNKGIAKRLVFCVAEEGEHRKKAIIPVCTYAARIL